MKRYQNIAANIVEFIDTVADAQGTIEILLTSLHTKGAGHVSFTTACSAGDKKIPVFRYIFASCKSVNKILVKLASGSVIDIHDTFPVAQFKTGSR